MRGKQLVIAKGKKGILLTLAMLVLVLGACNRGNPQGMRFASTSDPGVGNAPINNGLPGNPAAPGVSYADVVSRVSPAVNTIHSGMRVRAPRKYSFMDDPLFLPVFCDHVPQQVPVQHRSWLGSGVTISTHGDIL